MWALALLGAGVALSTAGTSFAYPPFDGTDAAVVDANELELEAGPAFDELGSVFAPGAALIVGVGHGIELSAETHDVLEAGPRADEPMPHFEETEMAMKAVLRPGSLQGLDGPSVATEVAILIPSDDSGTRADGGASPVASIAIIVSQQLDPLTIHCNALIERSPEGATELAGSAIFDASEELLLRPVAELGLAASPHDAPELSLLLGTIWQASDDLSVALGVKATAQEGVVSDEVRLGFTWTMSRADPPRSDTEPSAGNSTLEQL